MKVTVSQPFAPDVVFDCFDGWRADEMEQRVERALRAWSNITGLRWAEIVTTATNGSDEMVEVESPLHDRPRVTLAWRIEE